MIQKVERRQGGLPLQSALKCVMIAHPCQLCKWSP
jgi:hypothetical protein